MCVYMFVCRDKSVLESKMEFENLVWASVADERDLQRHQMRQDMDFLETAKFGGLIGPTDLAKQSKQTTLFVL